MPPVKRPDRVVFPDLGCCCWELVDLNSWLELLFVVLVDVISSLSDTMHWLDKRFDVADADFEV